MCKNSKYLPFPQSIFLLKCFQIPFGRPNIPEVLFRVLVAGGPVGITCAEKGSVAWTLGSVCGKKSYSVFSVWWQVICLCPLPLKTYIWVVPREDATSWKISVVPITWADLLEKTLMLGKIEDQRWGRQRMRWLGGITDSLDMNLGKF